MSTYYLPAMPAARHIQIWTQFNLLHTKESKLQPTIGHERPEGVLRYSSMLSLTLAVDGVGG